MDILILEDDQVFGETLLLLLELEGYKPLWVRSIEEAEEITFNHKFDLYLFDINLPDGQGLKLLDLLRKASDETPTIFITGLIDLKYMEEGFKLGAIDYIKKPFQPEELLLRIASKFQKSDLYYGNVVYNPHSQIVMLDKKVINLGRVATTIFAELLNNVGKMVSKEILLDLLDQPSDVTLRVGINKIKKNLSIDIKNIHAKGYMLEEL